MPVVHDLDDLLFPLDPIVDVIRFAQEPTDVCSPAIRRPKVGEVHQGFRAIYQIIAKPNGSIGVLSRNVTDDLLEFFERLRSEDYFPAHPRILSRTRSRGTP